MCGIKKGKITLIVTITVLFVTFLFIKNPSTKGDISESSPSKSPEIQPENEQKLKDADEILTLLSQKDGFLEQVNNNLKDKGYVGQILLMVYSKDDIRVKYILANKDATESVQEEVKWIFYESVEDHSLDANSINLKIGDSNDGSDW